jgi:hypothetical protein
MGSRQLVVGLACSRYTSPDRPDIPLVGAHWKYACVSAKVLAIVEQVMWLLRSGAAGTTCQAEVLWLTAWGKVPERMQMLPAAETCGLRQG